MTTNQRSRTGTLLVALALVLVTAPSRAQAQDQPIRSGFGKGAYPLGATYADVQKVVEPEYPVAAIVAGIQGEVRLEVVVGDTGRVADVRVVKSLDVASGVDASAMEAVRQWTFSPAVLGGKRVAVVVPARVTFYLHPAGDPTGKPFTESGLTALHDDAARSDFVTANTPGLTMPMVSLQVKPKYTPDAMRQKIQGVVEVEAIVGVDGRLTSLRVIKSLDKEYGLDNAALEAARGWRFTPGRLKGAAVPVRVTLSLEFKLH